MKNEPEFLNEVEIKAYEDMRVLVNELHLRPGELYKVLVVTLSNLMIDWDGPSHVKEEILKNCPNIIMGFIKEHEAKVRH